MNKMGDGEQMKSKNQMVNYNGIVALTLTTACYMVCYGVHHWFCQIDSIIDKNVVQWNKPHEKVSKKRRETVREKLNQIAKCKESKMAEKKVFQFLDIC